MAVTLSDLILADIFFFFVAHARQIHCKAFFTKWKLTFCDNIQASMDMQIEQKTGKPFEDHIYCVHFWVNTPRKDTNPSLDHQNQLFSYCRADQALQPWLVIGLREEKF